jgi:hypothetical protein
MVRVKDILGMGLSRATIYLRARKLGLYGVTGGPLRFTREEVRRILAYKPERAGRKRRT